MRFVERIRDNDKIWAMIQTYILHTYITAEKNYSYADNVSA